MPPDIRSVAGSSHRYTKTREISSCPEVKPAAPPRRRVQRLASRVSRTLAGHVKAAGVGFKADGGNRKQLISKYKRVHLTEEASPGFMIA